MSTPELFAPLVSTRAIARVLLLALSTPGIEMAARAWLQRPVVGTGVEVVVMPSVVEPSVVEPNMVIPSVVDIVARLLLREHLGYDPVRRRHGVPLTGEHGHKAPST